MSNFLDSLRIDLGYLKEDNENENENENENDGTDYNKKFDDRNTIFEKSFNEFRNDFFENTPQSVKEWGQQLLINVLEKTGGLKPASNFEKYLRTAAGRQQSNLHFQYFYSDNKDKQPDEHGDGSLYRITFFNKNINSEIPFTKTGAGIGKAFKGKVRNIEIDVKIEHFNFIAFLKAIFATFSIRKDLLSNRTKKIKEDENIAANNSQSGPNPTKDQERDTRNNNISKTHDAYMAKHFNDRGQGNQHSYSKHSVDD